MTVRPITADPAQPSASETLPPPENAAVKAWSQTFYASAEKSDVPVSELNKIVRESADLASAQAKLIDAMAEAKNKDKPSAGGALVPLSGNSSSRMTTESPIWISACEIVPPGPGKR